MSHITSIQGPYKHPREPSDHQVLFPNLTKPTRLPKAAQALTEYIDENERPAYSVFVDFKGAFDNVN